METKGTIQRIEKTKRWFFEKVDKIDKPLAKLTNGEEVREEEGEGERWPKLIKQKMKRDIITNSNKI
jgi:hypothetical protein